MKTRMTQNDVAEFCEVLRDNGLFVSRWIPVNERLPEIGDFVLCSIADRYSKHKIIAIVQYNRADDGIIEAWMPLPKPYDPQGSEEE